MTERERLIELLRQAGITWFPTKVADYLLANNVVALPCKVGDTVYTHTRYGIREIKVETIHCWSSGIWKFNGWSGKGTYRVGYEFSFTDIGKTVFLTKEEAEKALEEK